MPHKVGNRWKWGNVERSSKEDLRKTVYGIWMKNGSKGSFSKFWETGRVSESDGAAPKAIDFPADEIENLRGRGWLVTTRVDRDFGSYDVGDAVEVPWGGVYRVVRKLVIHDVHEHPFYRMLTQDQIDLISEYHDIAVLVLVRETPQRLAFRRIPRDTLPALLNGIEVYCENERFNRVQFEKYLSSPKRIDDDINSMYYGLFDGNRCLALSYLNKVPDGCVLIAEVQCVEHGCGRPLIKDILERSHAVWLSVDPKGGERLLEYYRTFDMDEIALENSKWNDGREQHFFLRSDDPSMVRRMSEYISSAGVF